MLNLRFIVLTPCTHGLRSTVEGIQELGLGLGTAHTQQLRILAANANDSGAIASGVVEVPVVLRGEGGEGGIAMLARSSQMHARDTVPRHTTTRSSARHIRSVRCSVAVSTEKRNSELAFLPLASRRVRATSNGLRTEARLCALALPRDVPWTLARLHGCHATTKLLLELGALLGGNLVAARQLDSVVSVGECMLVDTVSVCPWKVYIIMRGVRVCWCVCVCEFSSTHCK